MMSERQHFSVKDTDLIPPEERDNYASREYPLPKRINISDKSTTILWIAASWVIIIFNVAMCLISLRDMLNSGYTPLIHLFSITIFVAAIGGLVFIHQFIIKR